MKLSVTSENLVLLSGGPDSAWALLQALRTERPTRALRMALPTTPRETSEAIAAETIYARLAAEHSNAAEMIRCEFRYRLPWMDAKLLLAGLVPSIIRSRPKIRSVWYGAAIEEGGTDESRALARGFRAMLEAATAAINIGPIDVNPFELPSKARIRRDLSEELWGLTTSCSEGRRCGHCKKCRLRGMAAGPTEA